VHTSKGFLTLGFGSMYSLQEQGWQGVAKERFSERYKLSLYEKVLYEGQA